MRPRAASSRTWARCLALPCMIPMTPGSRSCGSSPDSASRTPRPAPPSGRWSTSTDRRTRIRRRRCLFVASPRSGPSTAPPPSPYSDAGHGLACRGAPPVDALPLGGKRGSGGPFGRADAPDEQHASRPGPHHPCFRVGPQAARLTADLIRCLSSLPERGPAAPALVARASLAIDRPARRFATHQDPAHTCTEVRRVAPSTRRHRFEGSWRGQTLYLTWRANITSRG